LLSLPPLEPFARRLERMVVEAGSFRHNAGAVMLTTVCSILFAFTGIFLMFIILLQRGRGGGLAGAFGASGGQSAFGTKAGDVFTKITIGVAVVWVALACATGYAMRYNSSGLYEGDAPPDTEAVIPGGVGQPAPKGADNFEVGNKPSEPSKAAPKSGAEAKSAPAQKSGTTTPPVSKSSPTPASKSSTPGKDAASKSESK
jgi:preprotein translocase subunit SecG